MHGLSGLVLGDVLPDAQGVERTLSSGVTGGVTLRQLLIVLSAD